MIELQTRLYCVPNLCTASGLPPTTAPAGLHNPGQRRPALAEVPRCGAAETRHAIAAADHDRAAGTPAKTRAQVLHAWFRAINDNAEDPPA